MVNKSNLLTDLEYGWRRHLEEPVLSIWISKDTHVPLVMADKRKLQCEIDRTLKKIVEGIEVFDDMWEKVHTATNCNMKEKQEAELKKEIKKLQRLRDFVKNWLASNEIKDKNSLLEHKKLIELKMEQFKVIERETKTKAYSTVGLGSVAKIDPKEKEKDDIRSWLSSQIDALNLQVDQIECEVESITSKKKKLEKEKLEQLENYKHHLEQHRFHIGRLELTMRLVDNDVLDLQLINKIKDNVEYYISLGINRPISSDDSMMYLYDELNLDEESEALGSKLSSKLLCDGDERISETSDPGRESLPSPISSPTFHSLKSVCEDDEKPKLMSLLSFDSQTNGPSHHHHHHHHSSLKGSTSLSSHHHYNAKHFNEVVSSSSDISKTLAEETRRNSSVFIVSTSSETSSATTAKSIIPLLAQNYAKVAGSHVNNKANPPPSETRSSSSPSNITALPSFTMPDLSTTTQVTTTAATLITSVPMPSSSPHLSLKQLSLSAAMRSSQLENSGFFDGKVQVSTQASSCVFPPPPTANNISSHLTGSHPSQTSHYITSTSLHFLTPPQSIASPTSATKTIHFHPLLGVAPLGQQPLDKTQKLQLVMVETALHRLPQPVDSEKLRPGLQRNPGNLPPHYTPLNPPIYDSIEFFNQLQIETLFFIFYYMEGTKAQYLAAKALKLKSWRFHTKLLMWFQRFEEPKLITEEFEQGSYLFFDFETWAQRQQDEFMFEYRYLEDHDFN